jgi:hypothetical protein
VVGPAEDRPRDEITKTHINLLFHGRPARTWVRASVSERSAV